jgi:hypothetical protein
MKSGKDTKKKIRESRPVKKTREILLFHSTEAYCVVVPGQPLADFLLVSLQLQL